MIDLELLVRAMGGLVKTGHDGYRILIEDEVQRLKEEG